MVAFNAFLLRPDQLSKNVAQATLSAARLNCGTRLLSTYEHQRHSDANERDASPPLERDAFPEKDFSTQGACSVTNSCDRYDEADIFN